ncbi:5-aminolevulinate synthase [Cystobacter fuscus DSM 2262]|uniref:5-aminolevulinate synthase n=1 Tax=Cystobacter fuscus (strain ATCC 25194 / DSM 2262 / NBRC 100088 / M29) TaxID=1242864 RepID=S9P7K9_CYSF2|nr:5-aminolevulinate synthase [Cystobacter fuscus]EPX58197.1 5-aminolevulinate synthase [Cystobacter fuscus DSM 2262]
MTVLKQLASEIDTVKAQGRYRTYLNLERRVDLSPTALVHEANGTREISVWCSNDYLGMSQHPVVVSSVVEAVQRVGLGTGGARSISGTSIYHQQLEAELASLYRKPRALLFSTGFTANDATITTLGRKIPGLVIFSDELNHASIIHGVRNSGADKRIFRHNDVAHLRQLLSEVGADRPKLIAFESLYSMEGDFAPVAEIVKLANEFGAMTYLDEIHSAGIYGREGSGYAEHLGLRDQITIFQGGFGKGYGGAGGYIVGPEEIVDTVRSFAVQFVFSTSAPAPVVAGALASVRHLRHDATQRELLMARSGQLKAALAASGIPLVSSDSHILPVLVGNAHQCKAVSARLLEGHGFYVQPVNAPTVPEGTERLRVTPTSRHTEQETTKFAKALDQVWSELNLPRRS